MRIRIIILIFLALLLTSCNIEGSDGKMEGKLNTEKDLLQLKEDSKDVIVSKKMDLLNESDEVASGFDGFDKVLSFIPDEEFIQNESVQGDDFSYLKLPKTKSIISGKLKYENNTKENIVVQSIFLQGNKNIKIKTTNSTKWVPAIIFDVAPHTSITINIDLKWDKDGMQELTFFPLEKNSDAYRYNGSSLGSYRFFVQSKDINIGKDLIQEQVFNLSQSKLSSIQNFLPEPYWMGENNTELEYLIKKKKPLTNEKINSLKFEPVPYNTTVDVLLIDEYGNTSIVEENIRIKSNKNTFINLDKNILNRMYKNNRRHFFLIMNNREEGIIADVKALQLYKKPFPTSFQKVLEFYKTDKQ
ncbi:hypothetical protein MHI39_09825 [Heyndrickxia sp. FSL K6-6286]|uniref:hypothetical protein n=1 Tax=Heyndrickxia sp. FSL K6-6286 TaxID=2921510 RepID=UPI0007172731